MFDKKIEIIDEGYPRKPTEQELVNLFLNHGDRGKDGTQTPLISPVKLIKQMTLNRFDPTGLTLEVPNDLRTTLCGVPQGLCVIEGRPVSRVIGQDVQWEVPVHASDGQSYLIPEQSAILRVPSSIREKPKFKSIKL